jgi:sensor c-di-GMP phosphodiesterase-like protein
VNLIAEGVEQEEQVEALRTLGCAVIQGHAFSKPLPQSDFLEWVRQFQRSESEIDVEVS